jgi:hypothetical protein
MSFKERLNALEAAAARRRKRNAPEMVALHRRLDRIISGWPDADQKDFRHDWRAALPRLGDDQLLELMTLRQTN